VLLQIAVVAMTLAGDVNGVQAHAAVGVAVLIATPYFFIGLIFFGV